jgi:SWI/SNF-related matrix-associated actin-dependent regulator of chromatin subfamily B member 1
MKLDDQFEWDVGCASNSPEQFATLYTTELGLPGEFTTAIAHQIREQVHAYRKTLSLLGAGGHVTDDDDLRPAFLPPVTHASVARTVDTASAHMPLLNYMSDGEIERTERDRDKELKRKRRTARGRALGPRLVPDRTHRTPGIGFPELDSAALQAAQAASVPTTSRRAAAAAASLTIANMVASENGGVPVQLGVPEAGRPPIGAAKEAAAAAAAAKKAAALSASARVPPRLFKAPPFPPAVLRARAKIVAPTASTGLDPGKYRGAAPKEAVEAAKEEAQTVVAQPAPPAKLTAKQLRDLEKEAKEKEFAEGQHENMIDGVWHCSNCGCPETIAVGRRKGPLGDKSQCGPCGESSVGLFQRMGMLNC